mmetsp:Transcript_14124/g.55622  ORF Transcript_14124/g.55622 Transcript_14124/m.55622 type:complete len:262 (+) Transcript_14124:334-1119(+)
MATSFFMSFAAVAFQSLLRTFAATPFFSASGPACSSSSLMPTSRRTSGTRCGLRSLTFSTTRKRRRGLSRSCFSRKASGLSSYSLPSAIMGFSSSCRTSATSCLGVRTPLKRLMGLRSEPSSWSGWCSIRSTSTSLPICITSCMSAGLPSASASSTSCISGGRYRRNVAGSAWISASRPGSASSRASSEPWPSSPTYSGRSKKASTLGAGVLSSSAGGGAPAASLFLSFFSFFSFFFSSFFSFLPAFFAPLYFFGSSTACR